MLTQANTYTQFLKFWEPFPIPAQWPILLPRKVKMLPRVPCERDHEKVGGCSSLPPGSPYPQTAQGKHRPASSITLPSEPAPFLPSNLPTCTSSHCICASQFSPCSRPWLQARQEPYPPDTSLLY